jgi:hypothetical protein
MTQRSAGNRGKGRKKGIPNKTTALLKDAILKAAESAGDAKGIVGYLETQARKNPGPFLGLLGKVLPMQVTGSGDGPIRVMNEGTESARDKLFAKIDEIRRRSEIPINGTGRPH